jgi:hypothetical protein
MMDGTDQDYRPIEDYALIGDCHGVALVSSGGSIDWCAPLRMDGDPVFFRLLDADRGGAWSVEPEALRRTSRQYLPRTNILQTLFETDTGVLEVTDFMPVGRTREAGTHDYVSLNAPGWVVRRLRCRSGEVTARMRIVPREAGFCTDPLEASLDPGCIRFADGTTLWTDGAAARAGDGVEVALRLGAGDSHDCVLT